MSGCSDQRGTLSLDSSSPTEGATVRPQGGDVVREAARLRGLDQRARALAMLETAAIRETGQPGGPRGLRQAPRRNRKRRAGRRRAGPRACAGRAGLADSLSAGSRRGSPRRTCPREKPLRCRAAPQSGRSWNPDEPWAVLCPRWTARRGQRSSCVRPPPRRAPPARRTATSPSSPRWPGSPSAPLVVIGQDRTSRQPEPRAARAQDLLRQPRLRASPCLEPSDRRRATRRPRRQSTSCTASASAKPVAGRGPPAMAPRNSATSIVFRSLKPNWCPGAMQKCP